MTIGSGAANNTHKQTNSAIDKLVNLTSSVTARMMQEKQLEAEKAKRKADKGVRKLQEGASAVVKKADQGVHKLQDGVTAVVQHPVGYAALATVATYLTLRGGIHVFHHTRRRFLRQLLFDVTHALDALGATFWLDFGCLLGIHRDGDLILHDNDCDLAVLDPDWPTLLEGLKRELNHKYSVKVVVPGGKPESTWIRVYCPLGMCDLFGAYTAKADGQASNEDGSEIFVDNGHGDTMHIAKDLVLPPGRKPWKGVNLSVPHDIVGTLERRYGPEWKIPKYAAKGADTVEHNKPYMKVFRLLSKIGIRI